MEMPPALRLDHTPKELVDACVAYCALTGIEPRHPGYGHERALLVRAIYDYIDRRRGFADLNDNQRRLIAGIGSEI